MMTDAAREFSGTMGPTAFPALRQKNCDPIAFRAANDLEVMKLMLSIIKVDCDHWGILLLLIIYNCGAKISSFSLVAPRPTTALVRYS
jgi:hypothetical protein